MKTDTILEGDCKQIEKDILKLHNFKVDWKYRCPPENRGAIIALLHVLGLSWEKANQFSLEGTNGEKEYVALFKKLRKSRLGAEGGAEG